MESRSEEQTMCARPRIAAHRNDKYACASPIQRVDDERGDAVQMNKRIAAPNKLLCTKSISIRIIIIQFDHKFMNINSITKNTSLCTHAPGEEEEEEQESETRER